MISEKANTLLAELKQRSAAKCYSLETTYTRIPGLYATKVGGLPYWTFDRHLPLDSKGNKMALLAQINLNEFKLDSPMPSEGILQFFLSVDPDFLYGLDSDTEGKQTNFKVEWHEDIKCNLNLIKIQMEFPEMQKCDNSPLKGEFTMKLQKDVSYISQEDHRYNPLFSKLIEEKYGEKIDPDMPWSYLSGEENDFIREQLFGSKPAHQILGNPKLIQGDPWNKEKNRHYDTLLFQLDSDIKRNKTNDLEERIMWGDMGIADFYINKQDLLNRNFNDVLYTWTCE